MNRTVSLFVAFALVGSSVPFTTQAVFRSERTVIRPAAGEDTSSEYLYGRRDLERASDIYQILTQQGVKDLVRPDINDYQTIKVYLDKYPHGAPRAADNDIANPASTTDYVAPVSASTGLDTEEADRAALTEARRIRKCYPGKFASAAAYAECLRITKYLKPLNTKGLSNPLQGLKTKKIEQKKARAEAQ